MAILKMVSSDAAEWLTVRPDRVSSGEYAFNQSIQTFVARITANVETPQTLSSDSDVADNDPMTDPLTRPELDAKLETIEAKMDGRLARIEDRFASIDRQFANLHSALAEQKNTAWKAAGAVIGVFVAVFAIYVASFDSGRETAKVAADAQRETASALTQIRQIVKELKAAPATQK